MPALIIAQIDVILDQEMYRRYSEAARLSLAGFGGAAEVLLASDLHPALLEGQWRGEKVVALKFASRAKALEWYHSDAYQAAAKLRQAASRGSLILIDTLT